MARRRKKKSKPQVNNNAACVNSIETFTAYGEALQLSEPMPAYDVPEGLTIGKPFKTLALGQVSSRMNGDAIGQAIDADLLTEMLRVYNERKISDPVIIDWQHATSPFNGGSPAPPESGNALGLIIDLDLRDDGLYATPAYNERGLEVVKNAGGVLWSSPEFIAGEVFTRDGGKPIGSAQLLAITLTPRPAQSNDKISRVTLSERPSMIDNLESMSVDDLRSMLIAKDEMVRELEDKLKEMKADAESKLTEKKDEEDAEKMAEKKDEEKAEKLAHTPDHNDDKKGYNMNENSIMLSEVTALREANAQLSERLETIESEKRAVEMKAAVGALLREGRIAPSEENFANKAYELKELQPEFWQMFSERPANTAVPLQQIGHGASGAEINKASLDERIKEVAKDKGILFSEALKHVQKNETEFYNKAMGV
tara:strand:+ start:8738 stop:10015 length:1278 start_codon:yes stop_codon:yes gene_type:complete